MQKKGFTLLELIIVVIIIGILASVALPQYAQMKEKAIAAEGINILGAVRSAQFRYFTEYGSYTEFTEKLDIALNASSNFPEVVSLIDYCIAVVKRSGGRYGLYIKVNGQVFCKDYYGDCPSGIKEGDPTDCLSP